MFPNAAYCTSVSWVCVSARHLAGLTSADRHAGHTTDLTTVTAAATRAPQTLTRAVDVPAE